MPNCQGQAGSKLNKQWGTNHTAWAADATALAAAAASAAQAPRSTRTHLLAFVVTGDGLPLAPGVAIMMRAAAHRLWLSTSTACCIATTCPASWKGRPLAAAAKCTRWHIAECSAQDALSASVAAASGAVCSREALM